MAVASVPAISATIIPGMRRLRRGHKMISSSEAEASATVGRCAVPKFSTNGRMRWKNSLGTARAPVSILKKSLI